jgi:hypothetical protein
MADHLVKLVHARDLARWKRFPSRLESGPITWTLLQTAVPLVLGNGGFIKPFFKLPKVPFGNRLAVAAAYTLLNYRSKPLRTNKVP